MQGERRKILLVEDDDIDREVIHRFLVDDHDVFDANSLTGALAAIDQHSFHCVLIDYRLPDGMGLELVPAMVARGLATIMLTGEGNQEIAVEAMKEGCQDYLVKGNLSRVSVLRSIALACRHIELERELVDKQRELAGFVSVAAHDLRTPIHSIMGMAELLLEEFHGEMSADAVELSTRIARSASRADKLISNLLDYSQQGRNTEKFEAVNLTNVLKGIAFDLREPLQRAEAELSLGPFPFVWGDEVALRQLFQNLIANALKFSNQKHPEINVFAAETSEGIEVGVRDNGIGIPPEQHEAIFAPFHRLHSQTEFEGSGIGLATCQRIVAQHDGRLRVESAVGEGSTFFVLLRRPPASTSD